MPKATTPTSGRGGRRHNPLEHDILATGLLRNKTPKKKRSAAEDEGESFVDAKASRNILALGRELMDEDEAGKAVQPPAPQIDSFGIESRFGGQPEEDGDDDAVDDDDNDEVWGDEEEIVEEIELDPADRETFDKFLPDDDDDLVKYGFGGRPADADEGGGTNLAELILEKIAAFENAEARKQGIVPPDDDYEMPPKVVEVYSKIGLILSRYRSGKLPKPFKILPTIPHWEEILEVTKPDEWTPNAVYEATRIFVSSKPAVVQRFLEMVVLPRVREDIYETRKLNPHLFASLKKGLYKPSAWFKGFLFPLVGSGTCTLREAHIVAGVLTRVSVPVLHSAAAINGLCEIAAQEASQGTEGGGATNIFIKALLDKRYALPWAVVDALVFHFLRFRSVDPASMTEGDAMKGLSGAAEIQHKLPVIWHQCLLTFAQRYRDEITEDQREALLDLLLTHGHPSIGPEVRRELLAGRGRGVPVEQPEAALDGDDTMLVDS